LLKPQSSGEPCRGYYIDPGLVCQANFAICDGLGGLY
jgi:hypothetical protein